MQTVSSDPLDIVVPDTRLSRAKRALTTCQTKLAQQTTLESKFYYEMCIRGWRRCIELLEAEKGGATE